MYTSRTRPRIRSASLRSRRRQTHSQQHVKSAGAQNPSVPGPIWQTGRLGSSQSSADWHVVEQVQCWAGPPAGQQWHVVPGSEQWPEVMPPHAGTHIPPEQSGVQAHVPVAGSQAHADGMQASTGTHSMPSGQPPGLQPWGFSPAHELDRQVPARTVQPPPAGQTGTAPPHVWPPGQSPSVQQRPLVSTHSHGGMPAHSFPFGQHCLLLRTIVQNSPSGQSDTAAQPAGVSHVPKHGHG